MLGFRLGLFAFVQKLEELLLEKAPMGEASLQVDRPGPKTRGRHGTGCYKQLNAAAVHGASAARALRAGAREWTLPVLGRVSGRPLGR